MTRYAWLLRAMSLAILLFGIGCSERTHLVGSAADGSAGGGGVVSDAMSGTGGAKGLDGLPMQDGPTSLAGAIGMGGATGNGGTIGGGGDGGTSPKDAPAATGGARGTGGATGSGGRTGRIAGSTEIGSGGRAGGSSGSFRTGSAGGSGGSAGSTGTNLDGGEVGTACEQRGGECQSVPRTADAYAWCVSFSGSCLLPAPPAEGTLGCAASEDDVVPICCLPWWNQPSSQCVDAGWACYPLPKSGSPVAVSDVCPMGWGSPNSTCNQGEVAYCCAPPVKPVCEPWP